MTIMQLKRHLSHVAGVACIENMSLVTLVEELNVKHGFLKYSSWSGFSSELTQTHTKIEIKS